ncbi:hypothetical protein HY971_02075 [Candidatus Kaiserbacteria bacterium]|nr:hypothetical protein [Candidatus Kaiserbacteria bacterium]
MSIEEYWRAFKKFSDRPTVSRAGRALYYIGIITILIIMYGHLEFTPKLLFFRPVY